MTGVPWRRRRPPLLCRWDLDKTYLRSDFDTLRQLWRTAWERGVDKEEIPGGPAVLKALHGASARRGRRCGIYFVSASPPQIGTAIREKLALDGVPYDDIAFKDQLGHLRRGRLRSLREHVGFKLLQLLVGRGAAGEGPDELLFGDDWESDPLAYSLYADVVAGTMGCDRLARLLGHAGVERAAVDAVVERARAVAPARGEVRRIFINLARRTPPGLLRVYGPRVVPTFNYFQTAIVLAADGFIDANDVTAVASSMAERAGLRDLHFENSLGDVVRRGLVSPRAARRLVRSLVATRILPRRTGRTALHDWWRVWRGVLTPRLGAPAPPGSVDYDRVFAVFPRLARGAAQRE